MQEYYIGIILYFTRYAILQIWESSVLVSSSYYLHKYTSNKSLYSYCRA